MFFIQGFLFFSRTPVKYNFDMANKKIATKKSIDGLYLSLTINFIALILILILLFRKRKSPQTPPQAINTIIQQSKRQQKIEANRRVQVIQNYREQQKLIPIQASGIDMQLLDKKLFQFRQIAQNNPPEPQLEHIRLLQQQLQIQRDRNQLLQQKQEKLEAHLINIRPSGNQILPEEIQNIKNQLQFCQERLSQSIQSQIDLKKKLADYERMSISMLNHPEYQRLRQLNNKYKDTIVKLQSHLLSKHQSKQSYFDLSFHNL